MTNKEKKERSAITLITQAWEKMPPDETENQLAILPPDFSGAPPAYLSRDFDGTQPLPTIRFRLEGKPSDLKEITYKGFSLKSVRGSFGNSPVCDWVMIQCEAPDLVTNFLKFADKILENVLTSNTPPSIAIKAGIREWLEFFRRDGKRLELDELTGLFGELKLVHELLLVLPEKAHAIHGWRGPEGRTWDFTLRIDNAPCEIEVKTTLTPSTKVSINSVDQLWERDKKSTFWLNFRSLKHNEPGDDDDVGSIVELINDVSLLVREKCPELHPEFEEKLELAKCHPEHYKDYRTHKFTQYESRWLRISDAFPALNRSNIPRPVLDRIERLKYTLNLAGLPWESGPI